jgi:hypothetical protein
LRDWSIVISAGVTLVCDEEGSKTDFLRLLAAELPYAAGSLSCCGAACGRLSLQATGFLDRAIRYRV